jgi:putative membrane protein
MSANILSTLVPAAQFGVDYGSGWGWGWHMMPYGFGFGGIGMIIWMVLLLALLFWVLRRGVGPGPVQARETPLDIIKRRYAAGEITREQFLAMKQDL